MRKCNANPEVIAITHIVANSDSTTLHSHTQNTTKLLHKSIKVVKSAESFGTTLTSRDFHIAVTGRRWINSK